MVGKKPINCMVFVINATQWGFGEIVKRFKHPCVSDATNETAQVKHL